jgi:8-oxo-dGTP pyrophosphatase MutT (NUDIX family)
MPHVTRLEPAVLSLSKLRIFVSDRLAKWERYQADNDPAARRAAVAIVLFEGPQDSVVQLVIIKRALGYSNPGQWALPGGRIESGESAVVAALRELREETSLVAVPADVLGLLDDFLTTSGYIITPVVIALAGPQRPRRSPAEVASIHPIPLGRLMAPGVPRWKDDPCGKELLQLPLRHDMIIHAPTGAILWQFAEVALRGRHTRVSELHEPAFTAR